MNRFQAAFIHLLISAVILGCAFGFMRTNLYPEFYFSANGGWGIIVILLGVDLIMGPLLTCIVYVPQKKSLKFDLTVVAFLQLTAFMYGAHIIYKERPMYAVYFIDVFEIVTANELYQFNPELDAFPDVNDSGEWPQKVYASMPKSVEKRKALTQEMLSGKPRIPQRPEYYRAFESNIDVILSRGIPADELVYKRGVPKSMLDDIGVTESDYENVVFYLVYGKERNLYIALNKLTGLVIGGIDSSAARKRA